jgi:hypothetical protein
VSYAALFNLNCLLLCMCVLALCTAHSVGISMSSSDLISDDVLTLVVLMVQLSLRNAHSMLQSCLLQNCGHTAVILHT